MPLQLCVDWRVFVYLSNKTISFKTSLWMVSYEVFKTLTTFGAAKATSNIFFLKTKNYISFSRIL